MNFFTRVKLYEEPGFLSDTLGNCGIAAVAYVVKAAPKDSTVPHAYWRIHRLNLETNSALKSVADLFSWREFTLSAQLLDYYSLVLHLLTHQGCP